MFDPILWPEVVNHGAEPLRPLSQTTVAKIAASIASEMAVEALSGLDNTKLIFVSPPCVHFTRASGVKCS